MRDIKTIRADIRATRQEMKAKGIKRTACFNGGLHGEVYFLNARMFALETELERAKPKSFRVIWWQFINLGGLGWVEHGRPFPTRKEAKAYVEHQSSGMSAKDRRRWKIEPVYS